VWTDCYGWRVPDVFTTADSEAARVRESAGCADLSWMLKFDLKGDGLGRAPAVGDGARLWALGPLHRLVTCAPPAREDVLGHLDAARAGGPDSPGRAPLYITEVTSVFAQLLVCGPRAREVLGKLTSLDLSERSLPNLACGQTSVAHVGAIVLRQDADGIPAMHVLVSREYAASVWDAIVHAGHEFNLAPFGLRAQRLLNV